MSSPAKHQRKKEGKRKRAPNYFSRPMQYKLLALVGTTMLVLLLINEARKPENWKIFFPDRSIADDSPRPDSVGSSAPVEDLITSPLTNPFDKAREAGWAWVLESLDTKEKKLLLNVAKAAHGEDTLTDGEKILARRPLKLIHDNWLTYLGHARSSIEKQNDVSASDKTYWLDLHNRLETEWREQAQPALQNSLAKQPAPPMQTEGQQWYETMTFQLSLLCVDDGTFFPQVETIAWFHMFEFLNSHDQETLKKESIGPVSFLQLDKQPKYYRGKMVTLRGEVRAAHLQKAPENKHGISHYYVFWVLPANGPSSPVAVYTLELPSGFPAIHPIDENGDMTPLDEKVEFTGFFFKRFAYRATKSVRVAPLLLAKAPIQLEPNTLVEKVKSPEPSFILPALLGTTFLGIVIALIVYRSSSSVSPSVAKIAAAAEPTAEVFRSLNDKELNPTVNDSMKQLSQSELPTDEDDT